MGLLEEVQERSRASCRKASKPSLSKSNGLPGGTYTDSAASFVMFPFKLISGVKTFFFGDPYGANDRRYGEHGQPNSILPFLPGNSLQLPFGRKVNEQTGETSWGLRSFVVSHAQTAEKAIDDVINGTVPEHLQPGKGTSFGRAVGIPVIAGLVTAVLIAALAFATGFPLPFFAIPLAGGVGGLFVSGQVSAKDGYYKMYHDVAVREVATVVNDVCTSKILEMAKAEGKAEVKTVSDLYELAVESDTARSLSGEDREYLQKYVVQKAMGQLFAESAANVYVLRGASEIERTQSRFEEALSKVKNPELRAAIGEVYERDHFDGLKFRHNSGKFVKGYVAGLNESLGRAGVGGLSTEEVVAQAQEEGRGLVEGGVGDTTGEHTRLAPNSLLDERSSGRGA